MKAVLKGARVMGIGDDNFESLFSEQSILNMKGNCQIL